MPRIFQPYKAFPITLTMKSSAIDESNLSGDPVQDLPNVLNQLRAILAKPS